MTRHLHIDAFSGVSGDMFLGALVDLGLPLRTLEKGLQSLGVKGYRLQAHHVIRNSLRATKVEVRIRSGFTKPLSLAAIRKILTKSALPFSVRSKALNTFQLIAEAEGAVHGQQPARVHFHEVGVMDSLIDIVGAFLGLEWFNIHTVSVSPINVGAGMVSTAHGLLPVPGPAVAHMAQGVPVYSAGPLIELATPTGIALAKTLSSEFKRLPALTPQKVGYGAGTADPPGWPNVLRLFLDPQTGISTLQYERLLQIETNIDDMNPQLYEILMERLFDAGALDVTLTPTIMKRSRPGIIVTVLAGSECLLALQSVLFTETSTLGVRIQEIERTSLSRSVRTVRVLNGTVRMKVADLGHGRSKVAPEYRDCVTLAERSQQPVQVIVDLANRAYARTNGSSSGPSSPAKSTRRRS